MAESLTHPRLAAMRESRTVSVVIPVKDDAAHLARCLRDLARQTRLPDEIVVVDNGSTDDSAAVAAAGGARVVEELRPGIPAAASAGYDAATGDLILRCDADSRLPPDWVHRLARLLDDPAVAAVSGSAQFYDLPTRLAPLSRLLCSLYLGAYAATTGLALGHAPLFGSNFGMHREAWIAVRADVHRNDPEVHDDLDLSVHLGPERRIRWVSSLRVGISARPFTDRAALARRFRRGMRSITLHWPAEYPPDRWRRRLRPEVRRGGSGSVGVMPLTGEYAPSPSEWARTQAEQFEASQGAEANTLRGRPIILLTTVGARTGKLRKTPLMRVEHDGEYAVVASKGGDPSHPVWYHNLVANPQVELQDGAVKKDCRAREVSGEERAVWWQRATATWPDYDAYQKRTDRIIPVFVLTPVEN
ncbi:MAG: glycosyl transferase family 2 [Naasia sp.]|nr:glycosyl transferase family 2 [Naasia sp.]